MLCSTQPTNTLRCGPESWTEAIAKIVAGTHRLFVIGKVRYIDAFGTDRETRCCTSVRLRKGSTDYAFEHHERWNDAT
jgi:hypothetical protein